METTALEMFKKTVQYEHSYIWVKPVCEFFELNVQSQQRKLKKDPILEKLWTKTSTDLTKNEKLVGKNTPDFGIVDNNGRVLLSKKGFVRWIQIINTNTVAEPLREKFSIYQELVFDYLYGNMEQENQIKVDYARLKKLRHLYAKIGREIQRVDNNVKLYMDTKFTQLSIEFNEPKQLNA